MAQRNKSSEYWAKRFELLEESQHQIGVQCFDDIERQYRLAQKEIEKEIAKWYTRFAENNSITMQQARKLLTDKQLEEFKWDVNEYIRYGEENAISGTWAKQLENASARYHISRLEALKIHTQQHLEVLFGNQLDYIDSAMRDAYVHSYNHTAYEIQKGIGVGWDFAKLDENKISKVINKPWAVDGKNFSERIWGNGQRLVNQLHSELTRNIVLGKDPQKSISAIAKKMETSKAAAGNLVMTESAFFSTAGQKDCFTELGVEEYRILERLDFKTCPVCGDMDRKHFSMSEWIVGVTAPPFHPRCRGTTAPYFEDDFGVIGERAARGADGKTYYVPADMTYEQWKQKQDDLYGTGAVDKKREMAYNESNDKAQFEKYKERLGADAPKSFADFQKIKYNNQNAYNDLKGYYKYKGDNPDSNRKFYNADKIVKEMQATGQIRAKGTVISAPKGGIIAAQNAHAMERLQQRGITIEKAQEFIDKADFALKQRGGTQYAYYTKEGFAVLDTNGELKSVGFLDDGGNMLYNEVIRNAKSNKQ